MSQPLDIAALRAATPGCANVLHFNNAGAGLPTTATLEVVIAHQRLEAEIGGYEAHDRNLALIEAFYAEAALLLNCAPREIAFVENATRAWDMAFYSLRFAAGDRILTSVAEYASNYIAFLQVARRTGAVVEAVPDDPSGQMDVAALARMLDARVKLIAVTHVPSQGGLVQPVAEIGRIARQAGVPFLVDACQSAGQLPLDVASMGCDMLSGTGRKYLRGPRGTGFLYVRAGLIETLEPPFLDLHAAEWTGPDSYRVREDARRFENWEQHYAGKIGLALAMREANALGLERIAQRVGALAADLRARLGALKGVTLTDRGRVKCGIVTFTVAGLAPAAIRDSLRAQKINVSASPATYARLDLGGRGLDAVVRASVHYYNTEQEVERFVAAVAALK